jgi:hypothetical protein
LRARASRGEGPQKKGDGDVQQNDCAHCGAGTHLTSPPTMAVKAFPSSNQELDAVMLLVEFRELGLSGREKRTCVKANGSTGRLLGMAWVCRW